MKKISAAFAMMMVCVMTGVGCVVPESSEEGEIDSVASGASGGSTSTQSSTTRTNFPFVGFCSADRQCGDSNDCTTDRCIEGVCKHIPVTYLLACEEGGQPGFCEAHKCLTGCEGQPDGTQCWTEKMILSTCTDGACGP